MSLMEQATDEEREGVAAIQFLLGLTNDKEPEWISLKKWRSFYDYERKITLDVYHQMKEEMNAKKEKGELQASPPTPDGGDGSVGSAGDELVAGT